jgi:hypothetical protein
MNEHAAATMAKRALLKDIGCLSRSRLRRIKLSPESYHPLQFLSSKTPYSNVITGLFLAQFFSLC